MFDVKRYIVVLTMAAVSTAANGQCATRVSTGGFGIPSNTHVSLTAQVFNGRIYFGTYNEMSGSEVWAFDEKNWTLDLGSSNGFGDPTNNKGVFFLGLYGGHLYATTSKTTGGAEVWRKIKSVWQQVNTDGFNNDTNTTSAYDMAEYNGSLYVATENRTTGAEVWKTSAFGGPPFTDWTQVNVDGFGDPDNVEVFRLIVFKKDLYACTHHSTSACRVYRYNVNRSWTQVNTDGFGDLNNEEIVGAAVHGGELYVSTTNESTGTEVWKTAAVGGPPFTDWCQVNMDGFGSRNNDGGSPLFVYNNRLCAGTWNNVTGGELWRTSALGACPFSDWTMIGTSGLGNRANFFIFPSGEYNNRLYVGTENTTTGCEIFVLGKSTELARLGTPPNPNVFMPGVTSGPMVGATWDPVIDHTSFVSEKAVLDVVAISVLAMNRTAHHPFLGTLLCDLSTIILLPTTAPSVPFAIPIPNVCNIVGMSLYTQGASVDSLNNIYLTNSLDITIGTF